MQGALFNGQSPYGYKKYSIVWCQLLLHLFYVLLPLFAVAGLAHPATKSADISVTQTKRPTSFSGAASNTLKNRFPPGETSKMLAMLPHLSTSAGVWSHECDGLADNSSLAHSILCSTDHCTTPRIPPYTTDVHGEYGSSHSIPGISGRSRLRMYTLPLYSISHVLNQGKRVLPRTDCEILLFWIWVTPY